jgi:DNA-binding NtrC family response regulator
MGAALSDAGFSPVAFQEPSKGLDWVAHNGADIVISDICMPTYDGFHVLKRIKELDPQCDVIFITAHGQMDIAIRALREGASDFFEKPFSTSALLASMERTRRFRLLARQAEVMTHQISTLSEELQQRSGVRNIMISKAPAMHKTAREIVDIAGTDATVLITGETGTGKELVAQAIHRASGRGRKVFLTVNCPSIPEDLFESEMFGHRRGAYTGAIETRGGYVEAAQGGTLFLDEVGDLPLKAQSKILRLLEQKTYLPLGEQAEKDADIRIIAATNQPLEDLVKEKKFREDLFYRLSVYRLPLPPLRDRKEDIPLLALYFALRCSVEFHRSVTAISDEALQILCNYDYPGNIRELRNVIESAVIRSKRSRIGAEELPDFLSTNRPTGKAADAGRAARFSSLNFADVERSLYEEALGRSDRNVSAAARLLGLSRGKLRRRMSALHMDDTSATT